VKPECLSKLVLLGEGPLQRSLTEYAAHYHLERNHQGKGNKLLTPPVEKEILGMTEWIDFVAADGRDGRSWRWSDIQTLANPDPWDFRVMAYREIVEFDLKQPLSHDLFDKLWDILYAQDLNVAPAKGSQHEDHNQ
jgi:hypothetical protein